MTNLTFEKSRHLVQRTGFGPELKRIHFFQQCTQEQAVEYILSAARNFIVTPPRFYSFTELRKLRRSGGKRKATRLFRKDQKKLKEWGVQQAIANPNALQEKMVWFWHNHFTSSIIRSRPTINLMFGQSMTIRKNALGSFGNLLKDMAYDPVMLVYLDGIANKKGKPNENFARELLELFTLGEGNYTEGDIKEIARAFAGWSINRKTQAAHFRQRQADFGGKTIFNQSGPFTSDDVIKLILEHPRTAEHIAEKFWREFISLDQADSIIIRKWAKQFRDSNYNVQTLLSAVLNSAEFWSADHRATLIKSPLEIVVGSLQSLDLEENELPLASLVTQLKIMGQDIYTPPDVKGWPGGALWINDVTLPIRHQFLRRLVRGNGNKEDVTMDMGKNDKQMPTSAMPNLEPEHWESWLLPMPAVFKTNNHHSLREKLESILLDPAYQLK